MYSPSWNVLPRLEEAPLVYGSSPEKRWVYEVSLGTPTGSNWLGSLPGAHRLIQALLQGQLLGQYELLDFLIWPGGLFTRVSLGTSASLSEFLNFLKEKTIPAGEPSPLYWDEELRWIKLVPPGEMGESTREFLEKATRVRQAVEKSGGASPNLFFFYRNPRLAS